MRYTFTPIRFGTHVVAVDAESGECRVTGPEGEHVDVTVLRSITPDGATRGACIGVFAWRMLAELQAPLHRRAAMAPFWIKAMQSRYFIKPEPGMRGCCVAGNTREVIEIYDRIRKEAGDFDADELKGLN